MKKVMTLLLLSFSLISNAATLKPYHGSIKNPSFTLNDLQGKQHSLKQYQGSVVLVQFWATYCTPCRKEMPSMNLLQDKLKKQGVAFKILAIDMGETKKEVQRFVDFVKPEFTILMDEKGDNIQKWGVFAAPSNFLIGKDGEVKYTLFGGVEWDSPEIINTITKLSKQTF